ncbi:MAG: elongation factor P [Candidatus Levybacteria bacterium]|nr:elongation factor P [Candidatus Levybacteria bacterium]
MISVTDLRSGTIFEDQGQILEVLSYQHIKMGRGSANIKVKVRNVKSGATTEKSFINGAKVNNLQIQKREIQFLYKDAEFLYFMDPASFEQSQLPLKNFPEHVFLKEGQNFSISFLKDEPLSINIPPKMDLVVVETGPGVKGNSATNIYKDAILENGLKTKVPLFIKVGDRVRVDTRTGEYSEKA